MSASQLVRVAGILGGLCWVVGGPLYYPGLALLVVTLLGIGAGLVSGLVVLRVVVALCLVALAGAVLSFLHHLYADRVVDAVLGGLMVLYCLAGLARRRPRRTGSHAA